ncbi:hypothetical protein CC77DRAFT_589805 [Alternaria alternata]|uniref:Uncharacterized protein n=1 Tax=Alternaria alternata TaxID=5599 RepID=A0A177D2E6_ALTAL|nr:hypothetical protein CC77DRAFT_589805 [Alternaria alternata]KAH6844423.1 hypothetical protein B0T12DRAFT_253946 [Alternaria alternata]OAG13863.1 hypothetical protein CC77DRAFT_589805 [Alternaria alternata]
MPYQTYPWWSNGFDFLDSHARCTNPRSSRRLRAPWWAFSELAAGPCCEFCVTHDNIPSLEEGLFELRMVASPYFDHVLEAYKCIHRYYKHGFDQDGPESYYVSREIERLSKLLRKLYFATGMHELASWSDQLKYMGRDTQMSSRRFRSSAMSKHRNNRGSLMPLIMF